MFQQFRTNLTLTVALSGLAAVSRADDLKLPQAAQHVAGTERAEAPVYFMFASDLGPGAKALNLKKVDAALKKFGKNILIGIDSGALEDQIAKAIIERAQSAGARLHIYVEGPGGVTGNEWTPDELARTKMRANGEGIDTSRPTAEWLADWNISGWKTFTLKQLKGFKQAGFESVEIDNLYNGIAKDPEEVTEQEYLAFFQEYKTWFQRGDVPRLMLKNLNEDELAAVAEEIQLGKLPRRMFADFHIAEEDSGDKKLQSAASARLNITTIHTADTYHYHAFGTY